KSFKLKQYVKLFGVGILRVSMSLCFFYALSNGPRIENNIITLTWPIFMVMFNVLSGEQRITKTEIICLLLSFVGSFFIVLKGNSFETISFSHFTYKFSLLYAVLGGFYYFIYRKIKEEIFPTNEVVINKNTVMSHLYMVFWQGITGVILVIALLPVFPESLLIPPEEFKLMALLGVVGYALPQLFISYSNLNMKASDFALLRYLNPVICTFYLYLILDDQIFATTIIGATLIFSCIYMIQIARSG
ncbi:MAG: DMT family transporter, partial [Opitutae bacterium]|nr:DMT family transporter [Opitutae bacterium]